MNTASIVSRSIAWMVEVPSGLTLVGRCTALLALAWAAHAAIAGRNPHWRVALWRSTVVGLAVISGLMAAPRVVTWRVAHIEPTLADVAPLDRPAQTYVPPTARAVQPTPRVELQRTSTGGWATRESGSRPRSDDAVLSLPESPRRAVDATRLIVGSATPREDAGTPRSLRNTPRVGTWLLAVWLAGVVVMAVRLVLGAWRLSRVVRRSQDAPDWVSKECRAIAARLGGARDVRVVSSTEVPTPCLTGLRRPMLLLPDRQCRGFERTDLRAILAHELAHSRGHDLAWNDLLHLASLILWFHPLAWRARAAHAAACDAVCDSVAADLLGDVASYARTLGYGNDSRQNGPLPSQARHTEAVARAGARPGRNSSV